MASRLVLPEVQVALFTEEPRDGDDSGRVSDWVDGYGPVHPHAAGVVTHWGLRLKASGALLAFGFASRDGGPLPLQPDESITVSMYLSEATPTLVPPWLTGDEEWRP